MFFFSFGPYLRLQTSTNKEKTFFLPRWAGWAGREDPGLRGRYVGLEVSSALGPHNIHLLRAFVVEPTRKTVIFSNSPLSLLRRARCFLRASSPVCLHQLSCTSSQREKNGSSASPIPGFCFLAPQSTKHVLKTMLS